MPELPVVSGREARAAFERLGWNGEWPRWPLRRNQVHRADLGAGIELGRLVPFDYFGLRDEVDYANIPWRNRRFDPEELARAVQTERRMERMWEAWREHQGRRTLVFCASVAHATFARAWLEGFAGAESRLDLRLQPLTHLGRSGAKRSSRMLGWARSRYSRLRLRMNPSFS